jgi:tRNA dimethylallyltransferase
MLASGWLDEIETLLVAGLDSRVPAFQAIGYRELARSLRGESTLDEAVEATVRATRRFAKRQMTWFRREPDIVWFQAEDLAARLPQILEVLVTRGIGRGHGQAHHQHSGRISLPEPQGGS